ncbi:hypothetical protein [Flavobacterium hercynium]|nr:hypothetical protein [Flavobacterium hercynium]SMP15040.1 hypothetical protein SAMN06265346_104164 [Flavobacterium hercynium]
MTHDRSYTLSKEIENEIIEISTIYNFSVIKNEIINVDDINLPIERMIKIQIQNILSKVNMMDYDEEYGKNILLKSNNSKGILNCKIWHQGDHVIGLEIEPNHIKENTLIQLKESFGKQFENYKIIWTEIRE